MSMTSRPFTVGIIQDSASADAKAVLERSVAHVRAAADLGAQIICLRCQPVRRPRQPRRRRRDEPGIGENATDQYVPEALPVPVVRVAAVKPDRLHSSRDRQPRQLHQRAGARLAERVDHSGVQLITPDNCSDAHDAICAGNNLSGAFDSSGNPVCMPAGDDAYQPEETTPTNYTGGLYASDLFLKYYIPLIEQSAAFKDGGLIDITFDEANPPFANSSFNDANNPGSTAGVTTPATAVGLRQVRPGRRKLQQRAKTR